MDDDFKELELELKQLRPVAPHRAVEARLEAVLNKGKREERCVRWTLWLAIPAAAAAVVTFSITRHVGPNSSVGVSVTAAFKPVAADNLLLEALDEGYVTLDDGTTARRLRQSYLDRITWKNPETNASLVWSVPREEIRVVPVLLQ